MERYVYRNLPSHSASIRLISLLPSSEQEYVKCEIIHYQLRPERPHGLYEALSYVWGDHTVTRRIYVRDVGEDDFCHLDVTANLHAALLRLRDPDLCRTLWIDAICIDQSNLDERAAQVQNMYFIYAYASSVVVWLGEEASSSTGVLRMLERFSRVKSELGSSAQPREMVSMLEGPLQLLLARPWFERIWVIQEAAAARYISILCGTAEIAGDTFEKGVRKLEELQGSRILLGAPTVLALFTNGSKLDARRSSSAFLGKAVIGSQSLAELISRFYLHAASDPKDRIFALCSMASDTQDLTTVRVNYRENWSNILLAVTRYVFGPKVTLNTAGNIDQIIITGYGCPIGTIRAGPSGLEVKLPPFCGIRGKQYDLSISIGPQRYAKPILVGDIVYLLDGAHHLSVLRLCGDHFDIVVPALSVTSSIKVQHNDSNSHSNFELSWDSFVKACLKEFPRHIVFVWDWQPIKETSVTEHDTLLRSRRNHDDSLYHFRLHSTADILDDVHNREQLIRLIGTFTSMVNSSQMPGLAMFSVICDHWTSYTCLKNYMAQLRWSMWALDMPKASSTTRHDLIMGYWQARGFIPFGLRNISAMICSTFETLTQRSLAYETKFCVFDEKEFIPLLRLLFPTCVNLTSNVTTRDERTSMGPFCGRYLMQLVCSSASSKYLNPDGAIQFLLAQGGDRKIFDNALALVFAILSESDAKGFRLTPGIHHWLKQSKAQDFRAVWRIILAEFADNAEVVLTILRDACLTARLADDSYPAVHGDMDAEHDTWVQCLSVSNSALQHCIRTTNFCELAVDEWDGGATDSMSTLQFVCETFNDPPLECPSDHGNVEDFFRQQNEWRYGWEQWKSNSSGARDQRIHLAKVCLLGVLQARMETDEEQLSLLGSVEGTQIDRTTTRTALIFLRHGNAASLASEEYAVDGRLVSNS